MKPNAPSPEEGGGHGETDTQAILGGSGHTELKWGLGAKPRAAAGPAAPRDGAKQPSRKNMCPALVFALPNTGNLKLYRSI